VVLGPRPTRVVGEVVVDLQRPRDHGIVTTAAFAALEEQVLHILRAGIS